MNPYLQQLMQLFDQKWQQQYRQEDPKLEKFSAKSEEMAMNLGPGSIKGVGSFKGMDVLPEILLTKSENKFFNSLSKGDKMELLEAAPSARIEGGKLKVEAEHLDGLMSYVDDVTRLREGEILPPSFYTGSLYKKFIQK